MCLTKTRIFPKLSQIPIKTYKILDIGNLSKISNNFIFFTPFMYTKVELNSMLKAKKIDILEMFFFDFIVCKICFFTICIYVTGKNNLTI